MYFFLYKNFIKILHLPKIGIKLVFRIDHESKGRPTNNINFDRFSQNAKIKFEVLKNQNNNHDNNTTSQMYLV